jgi:predicted  nucleic acid-binding Zn-ribbon protein
MKLKNLKKKIRRLEKRLQEGPQKLAKLKQKLQEAETAKALKAARKSATGATAARPAAKASLTEKKLAAPTSETKHPVVATKAKRKRNLSPERRAQLSAAMKARWAARRAAEASLKTASRDDQHSAPESNP